MQTPIKGCSQSSQRNLKQLKLETKPRHMQNQLKLETKPKHRQNQLKLEIQVYQ